MVCRAKGLDLKGGQKNDMKVYQVEGKRKTDQTTFHGLRFEGEHHAPVFITPGQFRTIIALKNEALELIRKMPKVPRHIKKREGD